MFRGVVFSDIHMGKKSLNSGYILSSFRESINNIKDLLPTLNMITITGDLYDRLLQNGSNDHINSIKLMNIIVDLAIKYNISIRVLEGTKSHDMGQFRTYMEHLNTYKKLNKIDLKYYDEISIERLENGITILYVPDIVDGVRVLPSDVVNRIKQIKKDLNIDKIDIAFMHGQFKYQGFNDDLISYDENTFEELVDKFIFIGHIHIHNPNGKIIPPGSFERYAFGEEEDKGFLYYEFNNDIKYWYFIKNKRAKIFKYINIDRFKELESLYRYLDKELQKYPKDSNISLQLISSNPLLQNYKLISDKYKDYNISMYKLDKNKKEENRETITLFKNKLFNINSDNIEELLLKELKEQNLDFNNDIFKEELAKVI